tara:strand:+ start:405 stop:536 length:132 start_codon:yes stop_codon:yes gene_type:complete
MEVEVEVGMMRLRGDKQAMELEARARKVELEEGARADGFMLVI